MQKEIIQKPDISIVILCYKTGDAVDQFTSNVIKVLRENNISDYELVLVGNYQKNSGDITPQIVAEIAEKNPKIKFVAKEKKGMMGWDMRSGMEIAEGNYISVIDGDEQMPADDLIKVYKKIKSENLDLVKTFRVKREDGLKRKIISIFYNIFFTILFPGLQSKDINSKPKIFTRQAYTKMRLVSDDWFIDAEIMIQARRLGFRTGEIPTVFYNLKGKRKSFIKIFTILEFVKNLIIFRIREFKYKK